MDDPTTALFRQLLIVYIDKYLRFMTWALEDARKTIDSTNGDIPPEFKKDDKYPVLARFEEVITEIKEDILFIRSGGKESAPSPHTQERPPLDLPLEDIQTTLEEIRAFQRSQKSPSD
jgi:hypothetical protein